MPPPVPERLVAKAAGQQFYLVSTPCRNGHLSKRSVATGQCVECRDINIRAFRERGGVADHPAQAVARAAGLKRYSTGESCKHGHLAERFVFNGQCIVCAERTHKTWHSKNPGFMAKNARERRAKDPTCHRKASLKWAKANPEKARATSKRWIARNPDLNREMQRAYSSIRRARKNMNGGAFTPDDITDIHRKQRGKCAACKVKLVKFEIDHIVPIIRGGSSYPKNLQLLCMPCNRSKGRKDPLEWANGIGRLC